MRRITMQDLCACAGVALVIAVSGSALAGSGERQVIENKLRQYEARFNQGDAEAVADLFSENVVYYGPLGQVFEGRDAVEQRYRRNLQAGFSDMTVETIEIRVFGDKAYDIARYTVSSPQGEALAGYHLAILEKEDGEWTVQRTLVNAELPAE